MSKNTIYGEIEAGNMPARRVRSRIFVPTAALRRYLDLPA
jgi:hypothetical protein